MTKVERLIETLWHAPAQVVTSCDRVNAPLVRQWCKVTGIDNPLYLVEEAARPTWRLGRLPCNADIMDQANAANK